jgi:hypothetical protein
MRVARRSEIGGWTAGREVQSCLALDKVDGGFGPGPRELGQRLALTTEPRARGT